MDSIPIGEISTTVLFIVALWKGLDYLRDKHNKPTKELEEKVSLELSQIREDNAMLLEAVASLVQHQITGNHVNDMEVLHDKIVTHLAQRGGGA